MGNPTDIFTNLMFACLLGFVAYLLFVGFNEKYMTWRAERERAARAEFRLAILQGYSRREATRRYKLLKREWRQKRKTG